MHDRTDVQQNPTGRRPWNKGRLSGQKPPLRPKEIWAIRLRLGAHRNAPFSAHGTRSVPCAHLRRSIRDSCRALVVLVGERPESVDSPQDSGRSRRTRP
jgi:hypothetical protein